MKVSIARGSRNSGQIYQIDTATNQSAELLWSPPPGSDQFISMFVGEDRVRAVLAKSGPVIYRSVTGGLGSTAPPSEISALVETAIGNANMSVSPDGRFAVGRTGTGSQWVVVDFASSPPAILRQSTGSFPATSSIAMMSFAGGDSRLVFINGDSAVMSLSTPVGSGQAINTALSVPLSAVPVRDGEGFDGFAVNGTVMLGKLCIEAVEAGFGQPALIDLWIVASDGQGGYASALYNGLCTAPNDSGAQSMGYLDGFTLKEALIQQDFSYSLTYNSLLPDDIINGGSGGIFFYLPTPSNPIPPEKTPFWSRFVSCFEVV
ncbi:hypothetical protein LCG56_26970 [Pseudomonas cannabina pv. alisalensis]|uniref:Uncharacterized protein n=1 Tax=Pseudomonas syringae pv. maculicola str. ES4326 TaxID=629265 RepID=A0A8T8BZL9_PSEYM|nr:MULTISPECIES: hypothetical protein [Pseudomonas syringae group]QHE96870.1 hypothetical protein PMA4326_009690 [Pseudomonas syringae pv. maculicola str. ES4326]UBY97529.1 hypothetical protein LCG56_26970 [Pseudomonas cannabina pv. alisalensis]